LHSRAAADRVPSSTVWATKRVVVDADLHRAPHPLAVLQKLQHRCASSAVSELRSGSQTEASLSPQERAMKPSNVWPPLTVTERAQARERAYREAAELRRAAIESFWRDADGLVDETLLAARRAASRLAARLREHAKRRMEQVRRRAFEA
jgi:hypothetical protein